MLDWVEVQAGFNGPRPDHKYSEPENPTICWSEIQRLGPLEFGFVVVGNLVSYFLGREFGINAAIFKWPDSNFLNTNESTTK